mmetsp:Transcript_20490/g.28624  ORF Transcript_20490/g.28624 Transcript_20490/m.28624 type:complete len:172 (+) Transcript_20490:29-544(+)
MFTGNRFRCLKARLLQGRPILRQFPRFKSRATDEKVHISNDMWVQRLSTGLYRLGVTKKVSEDLGGVGFVDICAQGSIITSGKAFGMVEGPSGTFTITSPVSGEVIECNEALKKNPEVLGKSPEDSESSWIIEIDSACDTEDEEVDWIKLSFGCEDAKEKKDGGDKQASPA